MFQPLLQISSKEGEEAGGAERLTQLGPADRLVLPGQAPEGGCLSWGPQWDKVLEGLSGSQCLWQ